MKVQNLLDHPVDFKALTTSKSFLEWVNNDITNAFYLGFMRHEFEDALENVSSSEDGMNLLKSIDGILVDVKPYLKDLTKLITPYITNPNGGAALDMVNEILATIEVKKDSDIYKIAYILGVYIHNIFRRTHA